MTNGGSGGDWPWPNSTLIGLAFIFRSEPKPLPPSLAFDTYDPKTAIGDSVSCVQHKIIVIAAMPTLEQHLAPDVLVGHKREERLQQLGSG